MNISGDNSEPDDVLIQVDHSLLLTKIRDETFYFRPLTTFFTSDEIFYGEITSRLLIFQNSLSTDFMSSEKKKLFLQF